MAPTLTDPSRRLILWRLRLSEFIFDIFFKNGKLYTQAETLSRILTKDTPRYIPYTLEISSLMMVSYPDMIVHTDTAKDSSNRDDYMEDSERYVATSFQPIPRPESKLSKMDLIHNQENDPFCHKIPTQLDSAKLRTTATTRSYTMTSDGM